MVKISVSNPVLPETEKPVLMQSKTGFKKYLKMANFESIGKIFVLSGVWKKKQSAEKPTKH